MYVILLTKRIHDGENEPKDIPRNYAIQNPNNTAHDDIIFWLNIKAIIVEVRLATPWNR